MPPPPEPTADTLLRDTRWVRSIARSLVTDPADADDLVGGLGGGRGVVGDRGLTAGAAGFAAVALLEGVAHDGLQPALEVGGASRRGSFQAVSRDFVVGCARVLGLMSASGGAAGRFLVPC